MATALLATGVVALAQLFSLATRSNAGSRTTSDAATLAMQKLEELGSEVGSASGSGAGSGSGSRAGSEEGSEAGLPGVDIALSPSPPTSLVENTEGYVDYIDQEGRPLGGGRTPPANAVYTRRWAVQPLPREPANTLVLQVLVTRRPQRARGVLRRLPEEARLVTVRRRGAP